jgi:tripartite-type tricarboxylate transporter receptor subunit TctC
MGMVVGIRNVSLACLIALVWGIAPTAAQNWPTRFITLIVPFGSGSASDTVARILAPSISEVLGQQVVVENVGGAGGTIGTSRAAKAAPDGYTLVLGAIDTFAQSQSLFKNPPYNSIAEFTPVGLAVEQPLLLTIRKDLPAENLKEFATYLKANQAKMQFASAGVGSAVHLACFQFTAAVGATVTHVPYRSSAPALQDLIAGRIDFYCPLAVAAVPHIQSNSMKAIAILTQERSSLLPNMATAKEQGFDGIDGYYWMGFFFPKGVPEPIVKKVNEAISVALDAPVVQERLRTLVTTVVRRDRRSSAYLENYLASEVKKWAATMKSSGVIPQ